MHLPLKDSSRSIKRAIALLRVVAKSNLKGARLSRLAKEAGLHAATAHRLLNVLAGEGFITFNPTTKLYSLGIELYTLGHAAFQFQIRDRYHSALERIVELTEDSVYLLIPNGYDSLCIDVVEGKTPIRIMSYNIGSRTPLGLGSGSLALLSILPEDQVEVILAANERRYQAHNGLLKEEIRAAVHAARENGFSVSEGLFIKGVVGVGLPICREEGKHAALSVAAIADRMSPVRRIEIAQLVKREVALITGSPD
ncbi:MAG: IclR family transcriptional regulator [Thermodesulfobacteriota bacterium]